MTKGEQTRQHIIQQAAALFNQHGYTGSSINDLMTSTGLRKGGIYRHFQSKEELALAAFEFAQQQSTQRLEAAVQAETDAIKQLLAFIAAFQAVTLRPPIPGGCPILNTIVDRDNSDPALHERAVAVVAYWEQLIARIVAQGIQQGSVRATINAQAVATILIGTLEGAIFLNRAHQNSSYMQHAVDHLNQYVQYEVGQDNKMTGSSIKHQASSI